MDTIKRIVKNVASRKLAVTAVAGATAVTGTIKLTWPMAMVAVAYIVGQTQRRAGHKSLATAKRYDHANEERYRGAIEALDEAGKTSSAEALAAARWKQQREEIVIG